MLSPREKTVLSLLADAWNEFVGIAEDGTDDAVDFAKAVHEAQKVIALRVARRVNPEVWNQRESDIPF